MNTTYLKIDMEDATKHKIAKEIFGIGKAFLWGLPLALISFIMGIGDDMGLWHFPKTPFYYCIIYIPLGAPIYTVIIRYIYLAYKWVMKWK